MLQQSLFSSSDNSEKLRILFIGIPDMATVCLKALIEAGKNIVGVIPPAPSHFCHNLMVNTVKQYNIPVIYFNQSPKETDFLEKVANLQPDLAIVCSFDHLLPPELFSIPKFGTINCHPSLLPEYRGGNPYFHIINNNEKHAGITIHYMNEGFDTGNIISQWKTPLHQNETMGTLFNRLNDRIAEMLIEIVNRFEKGEHVEGTPQDTNSCYKKATKIRPEKGDNIINWSTDAQAIDRFVRACNPFFGAVCYFRGNFVKIWTGKYSQSINMSNFPSGSIIKVTNDNLLISTKRGVFMPDTIQFGSYFVSDIKDFIKRTSPKVGEVFQGKE